MKYVYTIVFDDKVEAVCRNLKEAQKIVDEMVENYCCENFTEKELRKATRILKAKELK